jgi:carboxyl-terminal processing protease
VRVPFRIGSLPGVLLIFFNIAFPFQADTPTNPFSSNLRPPELDDRILSLSKNSIPQLSQKGKYSQQFRLVVAAIERYRKHPLETEKVAAVFVKHVQAVQKHFLNDKESHWDAAIYSQMQLFSKLNVSLQKERLLWTCGNDASSAPLGNIVNTAELSVKSALRLLEKKSPSIMQLLWFLWVESCIDVLDSPFNYYVYADRLAAHEARSNGKTFGPGFLPEIAGSQVLVKDVFDPILKNAGLVAGSKLIAIDGQNAISGKQSIFEKWLHSAKYKYQIAFSSGSIEKTIIAEAVPFRRSTLSWTKWQDIAYGRLSEFSRDSLIELRRMLRIITSSKAKGLILDLRDNPGGSLSYGIVDCFFKPGIIIGTYQSIPDGKIENVEATMEYSDIPLILLVNRQSISMSELFAAAVSTHKRGVLIGNKTHGKGVGQTCAPVGSEGNICLVQTRYFFPGTERTWNGEGISPDIEVTISEEEQSALEDIFSQPILSFDQQLKIDKALREALRILGEK